MNNCADHSADGAGAGAESLSSLDPALMLSLPQQETEIAVAVSGGVDSMALLLLLGECCKALRVMLHALTVDHHLRAESRDEAAQVAAWCTAQSIPHTTLVWQHGPMDSGIPEKARDARYRLMLDWCRAQGIRHLYTAHHLDDQIETLLFRLLRGSGLVGLSGILPQSERDGIVLHRPLLAVPKANLVAYMRTQNHPWLEDPSNQNTAFTRNALREHLGSLSDAQKQRFHAVAETFRRFREGVEQQLHAALLVCFSESQLRHDAFMQQPEELKTRILQHICQQVSGNGTPVRSEKIARLLANIETGKGKHMLHGVMFHYRPKLHAWQVMRTKPLAAGSDLPQNEALN